VRAQFENVRTLIALSEQATSLPAAVRRGYAARLRQARLNLGYALVKSGRRMEAVRVSDAFADRIPEYCQRAQSVVHT